MSVEIAGLVLIPVAIFLIGSIVAAIRGSIRFAQYMVRSEEAQTRTADTTEELSKRVELFMTRTEQRLLDHGERLAVVEHDLEHRQNGLRARRHSAQPD